MKLSEQLKQALSALAHAETGEMLSRREKWQTLADDSEPSLAAPSLSQAGNSRKTVVLSLGNDQAHAAVQYAISVCQRMQADLNVLCTSPRAAANLIAAHQDGLNAAGIACRSISISGSVERAVKQYLQTHPQAMFIISAGTDDPVQTLIANGHWGKVMHVASVPVVVAHDHRAPAQPASQFTLQAATASA